MPPLPNAPGFALVAIRGNLQGHECDNLFHVAYGGGSPTNSQCSAFAEIVGNAWTSQILPLIADEYIASSCEVSDLASDTSGRGTFTMGSSGARSGNTLSAASCYLVNWGIARRYRGGKPRSYVGGVVAADTVTMSTFSGATVTAWTAPLANLLAAFVDSPGGPLTWNGMVGLSYYSKELTPIAPHLRVTPVGYNITGGSLHVRICTQRRRLGKG